MMGGQGGSQLPTWLQELASLCHDDNPRLLPAFRETPSEAWGGDIQAPSPGCLFGESLSLLLGAGGGGKEMIIMETAVVGRFWR